MREVYIVDAVRTPVGRMGGTLKNTQAHEMGQLGLRTDSGGLLKQLRSAEPTLDAYAHATTACQRQAAMAAFRSLSVSSHDCSKIPYGLRLG